MPLLFDEINMYVKRKSALNQLMQILKENIVNNIFVQTVKRYLYPNKYVNSKYFDNSRINQ